MHFFDNDENFKKGINWYKNFFQKDKKINGEITPDYMIYNFVPKRIFETLGDNIKLIFLLRNPSQRAFSQFNFYLNQGVEEKTNFKDITKSEKLDFFNNDYFTWWDPTYYLSRGLYYNQIKRFLKYFKKENMHFILYEELYSKDFNYHMNELFIFLNLEKIDLKIPQNNESFKIPNNRFISFLNYKIKSNIKVINLMPEKLLNILKFVFFSLTRKHASKLDENYIKTLNNKFYKEDILLLEGLINKDLSSWLN